MKAAYKAILYMLFLTAIPAAEGLMAQSCQGTVPHYTINMTGNADSIWSSASVARNGRCCSLGFGYRCIHFTITLDANAQGIRIDVSGTSTGYTFESSCGNSTAVGDTMCLSGTGPHEITICRSGGSSNQVYTISSIRKPTANAGADTAICSAANSVRLNGSITNASSWGWLGGSGQFITSTAGLNPVYVPSRTEVSAGYADIVFSATGCQTSYDTIRATIYSAPVPVISGPTEVCEHAVNQVYSVTAQSGHSYDWHLVGGTITSGQGTNAVSVTWDTAAPGYIYMVQTDANGCQGVGAINTISRFDFNAGPITQATTGPDATSSDPDAYSNGFGYQITSNCGGSKGIDLSVPGSVFDRGKMCMTYSWQRDENEANFFTRGGISFRITGGVLQVGIRVSNGVGGYTDVGPLSTGYLVPNDDVFRYFTFCYDSATGSGRVMVHDSLVWSYSGTPGRSLYWTGAGNAMIGTVMDGSCAGRTLLDWSNISIPISILSRPVANIAGPTALCQYETGRYITSGQSQYKYSWSVTGGTILNGQLNDTMNVLWTSSGTQTVTVVQTDSITGCDSSLSISVVVSPTPPAIISGPDTICLGEQNVFTAPTVAGVTYLWSSAAGTFAGGTANDTALLTFNTVGLRTISVVMTNTISGCDSTYTVNVFVDSLPVALVTGDNPVCEGSGINNYQTISSSNYAYQWVVTGGNVATGQGTYAITADWTTPGTGNVMVTVQKPSGCSAEAQMNVTIHAAPLTGPIQY